MTRSADVPFDRQPDEDGHDEHEQTGYDLNQVISRATGQRILPAPFIAATAAAATSSATQPGAATAVEDVFAEVERTDAADKLNNTDLHVNDLFEYRREHFEHQANNLSAFSPPPGPVDEDHRHHLDHQAQREGSLQELTKRASQEDELRKKKSHTPAGRAAARGRANSISRGKAAGLRSPYESPVVASYPTSITMDKVNSNRRNITSPPVAGVTQTARNRTRSNSASSTGSVNKDRLLDELSSALRLEKRRVMHYEEEILKCEEEIDTLNRALEAQQEQHAEESRKQDATIRNLRSQLDELKIDLDAANDLDPEAAFEYLVLLGKVTEQQHHDVINDSRDLPALPTEVTRAADRTERRVNAQSIAGATRAPTAVPTRKLSRRKKPNSPAELLESQINDQLSRSLRVDDTEAVADSNDNDTKSRHPPLSGVSRPVGAHKRSNSWKKLQSTLRVGSSERSRTNPFHQDSSLGASGQPSNDDLKQLLRDEGGLTGYSNPFAEQGSAQSRSPQKAVPATAH